MGRDLGPNPARYNGPCRAWAVLFFPCFGPAHQARPKCTPILFMPALPSDARRVAPWWLLASFPQRCQPRRAFTSHGRPGSPWSSSPCRIPFYGAWSSSLAAGRVSLAVGYSQHQPELAVIPQQTCGRRWEISEVCWMKKREVKFVQRPSDVRFNRWAVNRRCFRNIS